MSDKILQGKEIAQRYLSFLQKFDSPLAKQFSVLAEQCFDQDDMTKYIAEYKKLFSNYSINTDEMKQIVYIIERIREYYK
jgi:hypothetical protein